MPQENLPVNVVYIPLYLTIVECIFSVDTMVFSELMTFINLILLH